MISTRIINSSFTDQGQLTSEQGFAMVRNQRPSGAQLDPNDERLLARYSLAVFSFQRMAV